MKLFNKLSSLLNNRSSSIQNKNMMLVDAYWNGSDDDALISELDNLLQECSTRAEKLIRIAELCLPATTNEQLYYASKSYVWAGASYRKEAIYYLEKYIDAGATYENAPTGFREINGIVYDLKSMDISNTYSDLAGCYEGEHEFDKAIENYQKASDFSPSIPTYIVKQAQIYVKKNQLNTAKKLLESAATTKYYEHEEFRSIIDKYLLNVNEKISNGYVYKPRKRK